MNSVSPAGSSKSDSAPSPAAASATAGGNPPSHSAAEVPHDHPDGMAVLTALSTSHGSDAPVMAKTWATVDGELFGKPYDNAWIFSVRTIGVGTFALFACLLELLKQQAHVCIIRGALLSSANPKHTVRRNRERDGKPPTFAERPRRWVLLDFDKLLCADFPDPILDPLGCIAAVILRLPLALRSVACFWSFSSSTGVKPGKLGVHLWFLLETPLGWRDVEALIVACGADPAMSRPVQVHYTACPMFVPPMTDPLPNRYGVWKGAERIPAQVISDLVATGYAMMGGSADQGADHEVETSRGTTHHPDPEAIGPEPKKQRGSSAPRRQDPAAGERTPDDEKDVPNVVRADGMIGDGQRHRHLMKLAGFGRSRGLDEAGLRDLLLVENDLHCVPLLERAVCTSMATSFAHYPVDKLPTDVWTKSVGLMAGLLRHGACPAAAMMAGNRFLDDVERASAIIAQLQKLDVWERDCAEQRPELVLINDAQPADGQP